VASVSLLCGGPAVLFAAVFGVGSLALQAFMSYEKYAGVLKWLCASLFAYVATVFVVHVPWATALRHTLIPTLQWKGAEIVAIVAVLGTTISPYLFFWQAGEEVEIEEANPKEQPLTKAPEQAPSQLHRIRVDTATGMAFSNIVSFFIILTAAAALNRHGITDISTATQAANALRPVAGKFAFVLFAMGIIGTGLLAVPVLAGSAAYAVGEAMHWKVGLSNDVMKAKRFYAILALATVLGVVLNFAHINMIKALFWTAVINGLVAVPIMILMMLMANNRKVMRQFTLTRRLNILGWLATLVMAAAAVGLVATWNQQ